MMSMRCKASQRALALADSAAAISARGLPCHSSSLTLQGHLHAARVDVEHVPEVALRHGDARMPEPVPQPTPASAAASAVNATV
jgi:hypothetical protein